MSAMARAPSPIKRRRSRTRSPLLPLPFLTARSCPCRHRGRRPAISYTLGKPQQACHPYAGMCGGLGSMPARVVKTTKKNGRPSPGGRRCYFLFMVSNKAVAAMSKATSHFNVLLIGVSLRVRLPSLSISTLRSAPTTATVSCSFVSTATESFTKEDLSVRWWTLSRSLTMRRSVTTLRRSVSPVSFTRTVSMVFSHTVSRTVTQTTSCRVSVTTSVLWLRVCVAVLRLTLQAVKHRTLSPMRTAVNPLYRIA